MKINGIVGCLNENDLRDLIAVALESGKKARSMWRDQNVHSLWSERVLPSEMLRGGVGWIMGGEHVASQGQITWILPVMVRMLSGLLNEIKSY